MNGEYVMRHVPGVWKAILNEMFIETTFMRYGHRKKDIIGVTLKPESNNMSQCMKFPTMWHFDMCRLGRASAASF